MKYQLNTELIDQNGEVVLVIDWDSDYHTRKSDYNIQVLRGIRHAVGDKFWISSRIIESWYRELTPQERVLYGR